jgi:AbrB family looped-hinge helix DNA binding protein
MPAATLTAKGQVVIPAEIRERYGLVPGTRVEFVDDAGGIRLVVHRRAGVSDPGSGYGMVRIAPRPARRLSEFDPAATLSRRRSEA